MGFGTITLSSVRYDNEPAVRSLSAIVVGTGALDSGETIKWSFDTSSVTARLPSGTPYTAETLGAVTSLSSIIFSITTDTYDYKSVFDIDPSQSTILGVTLLTGVEDIEENIGSTDTYEQKFDLFPNLPSPTLYINYENTNNSNLFYRQATGTYNAQLSVVFDDSFLNLTNLLTGSEQFSNTNVWSISSSLSASGSNQIVTPDNKTGGTLLIPSSGTPFNTISTITDIITAQLPDYFLHVDQTYVVPQSGYTTTGNGVGAVFTIIVSNSAVSDLLITDGGLNFEPEDRVTINQETLGLGIDDTVISFEIASVFNRDHFISRNVGPLTPQTYTYSVFAYPSGDGYLYFDGFNKGSAVFDIQDGIAYNNGSWDSVSIETYYPPPIPGSTPLFDVSLNGELNTIVLSGDRFFLGGNFTTCNNINVGYACAVGLSGNGPLTSGLTLSGFNGRVNTIATSADRLYVGGSFNSYRGIQLANNFSSLVCLTGTGNRVLSASNGFLGGVGYGYNVNIIKPDYERNIIFVGGDFPNYKGTTRSGLAVISPSGALVSTTVFNVGAGASTQDSTAPGYVRAIEFEPAGAGTIGIPVNNILIGGAFRNWNSRTTTTKNIARVTKTGGTPTGAAVLTLTPGVYFEKSGTTPIGGLVNSIQVDSGGSIYIGGQFEYINNTTATRNLVKLSSNGAIVTPYTVGVAGNLIYNLTLNSSGTSLYIGGNFTDVVGSPYYRLYRLDTTNNNIDFTFNTQLGFNNTVNTIFLSSGATKENDVIFAGGNFTAYKGQAANNIISLNSSGDYRQSNFTLNGARGWSRCCATFTLTSTETDKLYLGVTTNTDSVSSDATSEDTVYVWGAQLNYLETGTTTPYICTLSVPRSLYYNTAYLYLNNQATPTLYLPITASTIFTTLCSFDTSVVPRVSSYQVVVSASSTFDSLGETIGRKWYTPHIYSNSISAIFVNTFLSADFIAFAKNYFNSSGSKVTILASQDYTTTPGPCFYGEGHTETINLSADGTGALEYYWTIGSTDLGFYQASSIIGPGYYNVSIPTQLDAYPKIPIQLVVSEGTILSSGPFYYYDDNTGEESPYPFYYNTEDLASRNTLYRNGIQVVSYIPPASSFNSGFTQCPDTLPTNDTLKNYTAFLRVSLSGDSSNDLDFCFGLYDLVWRWSTFVHLSASTTTPPFSSISQFVDITSTLTGKPSSWYTTQCLATSITTAPFGVTLNTLTSALSGPYPKKWRAEASTNLSAERTPNTSFGGPLTWTLSTPSWSIATQISSNNIDYIYELQYAQDGLNPYTVSRDKNTSIYIQGNQIVSTVISAEPFDWQIKEYIYSDDKNCFILSRGDFKLYTSNRYVLTGTQVEFQNISVGFNNVDRIEIDLDNNQPPVILPGSSQYNNITATYTEIGYKTITSTVYYTGVVPTQERFPVTSIFTNIIKVVAEYDAIDVENYRTPETPLQLPWPESPRIAPNEWVNEDNINSVFTKFYENLEYLEIRGRGYETRPAEFFGWLGTPPAIVDIACPVYTWDSLDCLTEGNSNTVIWEDVQNVTPAFPSITATGRLSSCCSWDDYICTPKEQNPEKIGKYCISWKWSARTALNSKTQVTWSSTKNNRSFNKKWVFEPCVTQDGNILIGSACEEGVWNVNIDKINTHYDPIVNCTDNSSCIYQDIVSRDNILYVALTNEVKVLSSDYSGTFVASRVLLDDLFAFRDIRGIALDSQNKLFVLDGTLNRIVSYNVDFTDPVPLDLFLTWGGFGTSKSTQGFSKPNDISIDMFDNVWVADTGNKCIKGYSNTGTWLITIIDSNLRISPPISITTDSENNLHCLTQTGVRVYSQQGAFVFEYTFTDIVSENTKPLKINSNYNKEMIYIVFNNTVARYFRNGVYAGRLIDNKTCATNIKDVYQDEYRNTLVVSGDKILKYVDLMELESIKSSLPKTYWPLNNLFIHRDEYVQNWVYNKSFQRLWDNIELFRGSLYFNETSCKGYKAPIYSKEQIVIGQNEIVTSAVVNRSIEYLWSNFKSLLSYFDPNCS
jgi:hypothetical protein